ncbi:MAG: hypothetical protein LW697_04925 [Blastopirellula sp.]|nr:hypothetical protein [Blastopirellula sp.]
MRPALLTILLLLISLTAGCGSASPRVRREIALLRGEVVDLENQYYALKSMYRDETGREPDFSAYGMNNPGRQSGRWLEGGEASGVCLDCGEVHDPAVRAQVQPQHLGKGPPNQANCVPVNRPSSNRKNRSSSLDLRKFRCQATIRRTDSDVQPVKLGWKRRVTPSVLVRVLPKLDRVRRPAPVAQGPVTLRSTLDRLADSTVMDSRVMKV